MFYLQHLVLQQHLRVNVGHEHVCCQHWVVARRHCIVFYLHHLVFHQHLKWMGGIGMCVASIKLWLAGIALCCICISCTYMLAVDALMLSTYTALPITYTSVAFTYNIVLDTYTHDTLVPAFNTNTLERRNSH